MMKKRNNEKVNRIKLRDKDRGGWRNKKKERITTDAGRVRMEFTGFETLRNLHRKYRHCFH
jgi:hypothetical protein